MNILEALVQLRDDLKTWVTNNLNAINTKIEEKTIPIDSELSSTSTNPVQNKVINAEIDSLNTLVGDTPVATQISTAIASQDLFSGDYNDLTNAPNISEDNSDNVVIADEAGNIIFKVDADGAHTTDVEINGTSIGAKISVWDAKSDFSGDYNDLENAPDILEDSEGNMMIADESGHIIFKVDEAGTHTTALDVDAITLADQDIVDVINSNIDTKIATKAEQSDLDVTNDDVTALQELVGDTAVSTQISEAIANQDLFSGDYNDLTNAPNITEDGVGNMIIADESGNIIFQVDASGVNTTAIKVANQDILTIMDGKIADLVDSSPDTLNTLNELAAALGDDPNFATTVAGQIGGKVDKVDGMGLSETSFTAAEKTKLSNIEDGANKTVVESELSSTSENPVQSKSIYAKLDELTGMESVSEQISNAIEAIVHPVTSVNGQTGTVVLQYEDIENAPNIYEDASNELVIADPDGNIIFRSDGAGFETTQLVTETLIVDGANVGQDLANKVDKVDGKGLSTEDFTTEEKEKLSTLDELVGDTAVSTQITTAISAIDYPVDSVNGKTGSVHLEATDVDALPTSGGAITGNLTVSGELESQSLYTYSDIYSEGNIGTDSAITAYGNITSESTISAPVLSADSGLYILENGGEGVDINCSKSDGYTTLNFIGTSDEETIVLSGIADPVDASDAATKGYVDSVALTAEDVIDNLTSDSTTAPLSAAQGKALKTAIDSITTDIGDLGGGDMMKATYDTDGDGVVDLSLKSGVTDAVNAPVIEGSILEWAENVGNESTGCRNFVTNTSTTDLPTTDSLWNYSAGTLHNRWGYRVLMLYSAWSTYIAYNKYSSGSGWSGWVVTNYDDQNLAKLAPSTRISENVDINTIEYLKVGNYYCSSNGVAQTITNSPTGKAFMMQVYSPINPVFNDESTDTYVYRVRKIINYTGEEFIQAVSSESTAGAFYYGDWSQNATATNHVHGMLRAYNAEPRRTDADFWSEDNGGLTKFLATGSMTNNKPMADGHIIHCFWDTTNGWDGQLFIPCSSAGKLQYRSKNGGTWEAWKTVLDSSNYTDYISSSGGGSAGMIEEFNTNLMSVSSYSPGVHASRFYIITLYNSSTANFKTIVLNWYGIYYIGGDHYYKDDSGNIMLGASMSNYVPTFTTSNNWTIQQVAGYY